MEKSVETIKRKTRKTTKNKLHHWFILQGTPAQQFSLTRRKAVQRTSAKIQLPKSCKHKHLQLKGLGKRRSLPVMRSWNLRDSMWRLSAFKHGRCAWPKLKLRLEKRAEGSGQAIYLVNASCVKQRPLPFLTDAHSPPQLLQLPLTSLTYSGLAHPFRLGHPDIPQSIHSMNNLLYNPCTERNECAMLLQCYLPPSRDVHGGVVTAQAHAPNHHCTPPTLEHVVSKMTQMQSALEDSSSPRKCWACCACLHQD